MPSLSLFFFTRLAFEPKFILYTVHIAGLQETRTKLKGVREFEHVFVVFSPAVKW